MSHVYHLLFLFCCFFLCAQQLLWNMGTESTKYDRTVGYHRPIQLPWPNQVTILTSCMVLHTALMWGNLSFMVYSGGGCVADIENISASRSRHYLPNAIHLHPFLPPPICPSYPSSPPFCPASLPFPFSPLLPPVCLPAFLTTISWLLSNQIPGWAPAGLSQEGASPCNLLPPVALAWPAQPSWAACHWGLRVRLPPQEGWGVHQPLPLPTGGDPRWESELHLPTILTHKKPGGLALTSGETRQPSLNCLLRVLKVTSASFTIFNTDNVITCL